MCEKTKKGEKRSALARGDNYSAPLDSSSHIDYILWS